MAAPIPVCFFFVLSNENTTQRTSDEVQRLAAFLDVPLRGIRRSVVPERVLEEGFPNDARVTHASRQPTATGLTLVEGYDRDAINVFLVREVRALGARVGGTPIATPVVHARQRCILVPDSADAAAIQEAVQTLLAGPAEAPVRVSVEALVPPAPPPPAEDAELLARKGIELWRADQVEEARACLERAVQMAPDHFDAHLYLGRAERHLKHAEKAQTVLEVARKLRPDDAGQWHELSKSLGDRNQWEQALEASRRAVALKPQDEWMRLHLGACLGETARGAEAIGMLEQLTLDRPDFRWGWNTLAEVYIKTGRKADAIRACEAELKLEPTAKGAIRRFAELRPPVAAPQPTSAAAQSAPAASKPAPAAALSAPVETQSPPAKAAPAASKPAPAAALSAPVETPSAPAKAAPAAPTPAPAASRPVPAPPSAPTPAELPLIKVPARLHLIVSDAHGTKRDEASARAAVTAMNEVWKQAGVMLEVTSVSPLTAPDDALQRAFPSQTKLPSGGYTDATGLTNLAAYERGAVNVYFVRRIPVAGTEGLETRTYGVPSVNVVLYADAMGNRKGDVPAKCLLDVMGLKRSSEAPQERLSNLGTLLIDSEIATARAWAQKLTAPAPSPKTPALPVAPAAPPGPAPAESLDDVLRELQALVGLQAVKAKLTSLANYARVEMVRRQKGLPANRLDLHAVLSGPIGTGRKRIARLLGRMYQAIGAVSSSNVVECRGTDFLGAPAPTREQADNGILILEDVVRRGGTSSVSRSEPGHTATRSESESQAQRMASAIRHTIEQATGMAVIVIATSEEAGVLLDADAGLASALRNRIEFDHYEWRDLLQIFDAFRIERGFEITPDGAVAVEKLLRTAWEERDAQFSNVRFVSRLFHDMLERQANRVVKLDVVADDAFVSITAEDVPAVSVERRSRKDMPGLDGSIKVIEPPHDDTLEQALAELDGMIGLAQVKQKVHALVGYYKVQQRRTAEGLSTTPISLHLAFVGPPGTGKTTVARLMGRIFKSLGLLAHGHTIETDRTGFIGAYRGQTALKSNETLNQAVHGVLFIDEAYTLSATQDESYGQEAIAVILKRMEDDRAKLSVIAAGYPDDMERFFESNSGLRSRFTQTIQFEDYCVSELMAIFDSLCKSGRYVLRDAARDRLHQQLEWMHAQRSREFGNGRLVRTVFEQVVERQSGRLADDPSGDLAAIVEADIPQLTPSRVRAGEALRISDPPLDDTIDKVLAELDAMVGLQDVKQKIRSLINVVKAEKQRRQQGQASTSMTLHLIFSGPPGTGKTTVARLVGRAYRAIGLLQRGHLVETDRSGLVGSFLGQTAPRVNAVVDRAKHGVLFIDEAYALMGSGQDPYGEEAVNVLVKRLEDDREHLAVVLAGYTDAMKQFLTANAGLRSRFQGTIDFPNYRATELVEIFEGFCRGHFTLSEAARAKIRLRFDEAVLQHSQALGNGRLARQMFQETVERQANRLAETTDPEALGQLMETDIPECLPGQKKALVVNPLERESIAYHEVGHAIVGRLLPGGRRVERISIVPMGESDLGYTSYVIEERFSSKATEIRNQMASLMGGLSAQEVQYGYVWSGAHDDIRKTTFFAEQYVKSYGMSRLGPLAMREVSPAMAQRIDDEIQRLIEDAHHAALSILHANKDLLDQTAAALLQADVLEGDAMQSWLNQALLPDALAEWIATGENAPRYKPQPVS